MKNGWQERVLAVLIGITVSGGAMLIRGDMLGRDAAAEVEQRVDKRIDDVKEQIGEDIKEIKQMIRDLKRETGR